MKDLIMELLAAVITVCVPIITKYVLAYLKRTAEKAEAQTDETLVKGYIEEIATAISEAVAYTSQTYVDALKASGKFTKEAQQEALKKSLEAAKAALSVDAADFIEDVYGDLTDYLTPRIEAAVRKQKLTEGTPVTALEATTDTTQVAAATAAATAASIAQTAIGQINAEATAAE